jgi:hypothetical protein
MQTVKNIVGWTLKWHTKWEKWIVENHMVGKRLGFDSKEAAHAWAARVGLTLIEVVPNSAPYGASEKTIRRRQRKAEAAASKGVV